MKYIICIVLFLCVNLVSHAQQEIYPFNSPKQAAQFQHLLTSLRCLVCQNQDLASSNAPLAQDLKKDVYEWVQAGQSDHEIIQALTSRYGDFILFNPPIKPITYILWSAPMILLLLGLVLFWRQVNRD